MTRIGLEVRSALLWTASAIHFAAGATLLAVAARVVGMERLRGPLRIFCRNIVRLTGARFAVRRSPRFDPRRTYLFVANHVNVFDPFTLAAAIPQPICGFELDSHFRIPVYGWLIASSGNIPVPSRGERSSIERMQQRLRETLAQGRSVVLFPEGTRTRTGRMGPFRVGAFRMVAELGVPIVPVTQVGAFELQNPTRGRLEPAEVVVWLHDPIETKGLLRADHGPLLERVRGIIRAPLETGSSPTLRSPSAPSDHESRRA